MPLYKPPITATVSTVAPTGAVLEVTLVAAATQWTRERNVTAADTNILGMVPVIEVLREGSSSQEEPHGIEQTLGIHLYTPCPQPGTRHAPHYSRGNNRGGDGQAFDAVPADFP